MTVHIRGLHNITVIRSGMSRNAEASLSSFLEITGNSIKTILNGLCLILKLHYIPITEDKR